MIPPLLLFAFPVLACGPRFDSWILDEGEAAWAAAPSLIFWNEADAVVRQIDSDFAAAKVDQVTAEEVSLIAFLFNRGDRPAEERTVIEAYREARRIIGGDGRVAEHSIAALADVLPEAFYLYLEGAYHYRNGDPDAARESWERIIRDAPEGDRYRVVWAHYMLGRLTHESDPEFARSQFEAVRSRAAEGDPDPLGFAAASYGWEARTYYLEEDYGAALELYLKGNAAGVSDIPSLIWSLRRAFQQSDERLMDYAADPHVRRLMSAWIAAGHVSFSDRDLAAHNRSRWFGILRHFEDRDTDAIDQLALIAYQSGHMEETRRWVDLGSPESLANRWLAAKLALVDGDFERASDRYSEAVALLREPSPASDSAENGRFPSGYLQVAREHAHRRLPAEFGMLHLERHDYDEAIRFLAPHYWEDAAFLTERILTVSELKSLVDRHYREPAGHEAGNDRVRRDALPVAERMRALLARRLVREGRIEEAVPYFSDRATGGASSLRDRARHFVAVLDRAGDESLSSEERAEAYWEAARIARHDGLALQATELDPDWAVYGAQFERPPGVASPQRRERSELLANLFDRESEALETPPSAPERRFHYRYVAADYGWAAASLLPDQDDRTAYILWQSGRWLMYRDPEAADRFYKALVNRCGNTVLGRAADELRWFPEPSTAFESASGTFISD